VTFSPHPHQIEAARRAYDDWWAALGWLRDGLIACGMLREVEVTGVMPKVEPWEHPRTLG
jgi:thiazole synthase ThiGH ThiG subunit